MVFSRRRWRSPILRLALTQAGIFLLAFAGVGGGAYFTLSAITEQAMERSLRSEVGDLQDWYAEAGAGGLREALADRSSDADPDTFYALHTRRLSQHVPATLVLPAELMQTPGWHDFSLVVNGRERQAVARVVVFPDGVRLLVGHIAWERERLDAALRRALGLGLLLALFIASGLALAMSRAIRRALAGPLAVAGRFAEGELNARVIPNNSGDGFDQLARRLNAMFSRIQELVGAIAHTTDAIAHDLRTPLTRLRSRLEAARRAAVATPAEAAIDNALAETDRLLDTFQAILRLARLEADTAVPAAAVDLAALVQDGGELFEAVAEARQQQLEVSTEPVFVRGDRDQLFQLLVNLLDNAVKYSPPGSRLQLALQLAGNQARLTVTDPGPGIPEADRERVFDRFVRLEAHRGSPGNGLGLALVRAIVRHHGGRIRLEDARPGLRVVVELAGADRPESLPIIHAPLREP